MSVTPRPLFTPGKEPVHIVQEAGWAPGPVWKCAENLAPTGIRSLDRPARSQSLYRLRYPAHFNYMYHGYFKETAAENWPLYLSNTYGNPVLSVHIQQLITVHANCASVSRKTEIRKVRSLAFSKANRCTTLVPRT